MDQKGVTPRNLDPDTTILSNTTLYERIESDVCENFVVLEIRMVLVVGSTVHNERILSPTGLHKLSTILQRLKN